MRTSAVAIWLAAALAAVLHAPAAQAGTLTVKASWSTRAAIELRVLGPTGRRYLPRSDPFRGPATVVCDIADAAGGDYRAMLECKSIKGSGPTTVTVEVHRDGQLVGTAQVVLQKRGETQFVNVANPGAPAPPPKEQVPQEEPPGLAVKAIWRTAADIELRVVDPAGSRYGVLEDCLRGPGSETCAILRPKAGKHRIELRVLTDRGVLATPVIIEVWKAGRLTNKGEIVLGRRGDEKVLDAGAELADPGPAPGKGLTVTARWLTEADVDLRVIGPTDASFPPVQDLLRGPGHEVCNIPQITANNYGVELTYVNSRNLPATVVFVDVRVDGKLIRTVEHTLVKPGQVLRASTGWLAPPE
ncbi:MAG TPA: hypothetical protein VNE39_21750 [Planctomycetota bacterium]|nr:hypothetical protein [Planctomycetota bacterium]